MLNRLEILKAGILRTLYLTPLDFLTTYKLELKVNKELVKKQKLTYYPSQGYKLLVLALTIKAKEEEEKSILELVIPGPLLLPFKEVRGLNAKILCNIFLFRGKVPKAKEEDSKSNRSLEDAFITSFPQKRKARKASKKSPRKKLKIGPIEPLAFSKANR